jgi:hypothetical protein
VFTIELDLATYNTAVRKLAEHPRWEHCRTVRADSREWLRNQAALPAGASPLPKDEPVFFYLDAHWWRELPRSNPDRLNYPLWDELALIVERGQADIIVIDDCHAWGGGADGPAPFWAGVTRDTVEHALGSRMFTSEIHDDQFIARLGVK